MKKIMVLIVVLLVLVSTVPANAVGTTKRYTLPPFEDLCVYCKGSTTSAFMSMGSRKAVVDCRFTIRALRGGLNMCSSWDDKVITLEQGQRLIVSPGGDTSRYLSGYFDTPATVRIQCH